MLNIFFVCSVNSVVNDTSISLKPIGQVSAVFFDMTGNLPDFGHNLFNIQLKNFTILYLDTTVHHDIAYVRTFGCVDDMGFWMVDRHQVRGLGIDDN